MGTSGQSAYTATSEVHRILCDLTKFSAARSDRLSFLRLAVNPHRFIGLPGHRGLLDLCDLSSVVLDLHVVDFSFHKLCIPSVDLSDVIGHVHDLRHVELGLNSN